MNNCIKIAITEGFTEPVCQERPGGLEALRMWSKPPVGGAAGWWLCQNTARHMQISRKAEYVVLLHDLFTTLQLLLHPQTD